MLNQPLLRKSYLQLVCNLLIYIGVGCAKIIMTEKYITVGSIVQL